MIVDCHMHTPLCGHATGSPLDYLKVGNQKGIHLMTFTCHIPMHQPSFGGQRIRMDRSQLEDYFQLVEEARKQGKACGTEVLCGIEAEVFPVAEELEEMKALLQAHPFDFVLGSLHHQLKAYHDWLEDRKVVSDEDIIRDYFKHLANAAQSGLYHSMSHPDVIRIYGTIDPESFIPQRFETEIRGFLKACATSGTCMEVNTSGLSKGVYELHPDPLILDWAFEEGVDLTIGSDAHAPENVGRHFERVLPLLYSKGFRSLHYFKGGKKHSTAMSASIESASALECL